MDSVPAASGTASPFGGGGLIFLLWLAAVLCQVGGMFFALRNLCTAKLTGSNDAGVSTEFFRRAVQDWESETTGLDDSSEGAHPTACVNAETASSQDASRAQQSYMGTCTSLIRKRTPQDYHRAPYPRFSLLGAGLSKTQ